MAIARSFAVHPNNDSGTSIECQVHLDQIKVMADIGVHASEMGTLQPLLIDVCLSVIPPRDDELCQTFDYVLIARHAGELAASRTNLIETFARLLAERCLQSDLVLEAFVQIAKPQAMPDCMAGTRIRMRKR